MIMWFSPLSGGHFPIVIWLPLCTYVVVSPAQGPFVVILNEVKNLASGDEILHFVQNDNVAAPALRYMRTVADNGKPLPSDAGVLSLDCSVR